QVGQHGAVRRSDHGAVGHREHEILPACAVAQVALAETAAGGPLVRAVVVGQQRRGGGVDLEDHVTAAPAVGPVGPGQGLELLAADGGGAVPARSPDDLQLDAVDECGHGCTPMLRRRNASRGGAFGSAPRRTLCAPGAGASGQTVPTTLATLRSRLRPDSTVAAETLDAETLGVGVAPVLGGADALLRCHLESILVWSRDRSGDARDLQPGQLLAVALALLVTGLVLVAEDADLLAAEVFDLLGGDPHLGQL